MEEETVQPPLLPSAPTCEGAESMMHWFRRNLPRCLYIACYYLLSITVSVFNAYIIGRTQYNFAFPLFLSGMSALVQFGYACSCLWFLGILDKTVQRITPSQFLWAILPCALASSLDVGISNSALKYVSLSFYTMVKSSAPIFVLLCAFMMGLEKPNLALCTIMAVIGGGVLMTVWSDTAFDFLGFFIVLSTAMLSGIRWALTQIIIEEADNAGDAKRLTSSGPLATILYLAPIAFVTLSGLSGIVEGYTPIYTSSNFATLSDAMRTLFVVWIAGTLTFALILTEYKVVQETSVLTFSVAGIFKEIALISISMSLFGDRLRFINYIGIVVSISGIALYNYLRYLKKRKQTPNQPVIMAAEYELVPAQTMEPLTGFVLQRPDFESGDQLIVPVGDRSRQSSSGTIVISALDAQMSQSQLELIKKRLRRLMRPFAPRLVRG